MNTNEAAERSGTEQEFIATPQHFTPLHTTPQPKPTTVEQDGTKAKPSFQLSPDTRRIADKFLSMQPGEQVTYAELNALIPGQNVQGRARGLMDTARRLVREEARIVIECVHGIGMQRLVNDDIPGTGAHHTRAARRQCTVGSEKLACADFAALTSEKQSQLNAHMAIFGAIKLFTRASSFKRLEKASTDAAPLVTDKVLKLFS